MSTSRTPEGLSEDFASTDHATTMFSEAGTPLERTIAALKQRARWLLLAPPVTAVLAFGVASLLPPVFTATTALMPPQQSQSSAVAALASLGSVAGLAGQAAGIRNSADQYIALMQSVSVSDRIIRKFGLLEAYSVDMFVDARLALRDRVRMNVGKKDGLITIDVDDHDPKRAAEMANQYAVELQQMVSTLAVTEAQRRRSYFEQLLQRSRDRLAKAQQDLQSSGVNAGALKAEPRAAAEGFAKLKAEVSAAELRLLALRNGLADNTPEVRQQSDILAALKSQLARAEADGNGAGGPDYISRYREYKYQEALFELYTRQLELARADEAREGAYVQVVDPALVPERKSKPRRAVIAILSYLVSLAFVIGWALMRPSPSRRPTAFSQR